MAREKVSFQHCDRCGKRIKKWTYSRFTGNHYCIDIDGCDRRTRKRQRQQERETAEAITA